MWHHPCDLDTYWQGHCAYWCYSKPLCPHRGMPGFNCWPLLNLRKPPHCSYFRTTIGALHLLHCRCPSKKPAAATQASRPPPSCPSYESMPPSKVLYWQSLTSSTATLTMPAALTTAAASTPQALSGLLQCWLLHCTGWQGVTPPRCRWVAVGRFLFLGQRESPDSCP